MQKNLDINQGVLVPELVDPCSSDFHTPLLLSVLDTPMVSSNSKDKVEIPKGRSLANEEATLTEDMRQTNNNNKNNNGEAQQCLLDFVEWWSHKVIHAVALKDAETASSALSSSLANWGDDINEYPFGRLRNRLELSALSQDVAFLDPNQKNLTQGEYWSGIKEELILLKSKLLRRDANADIVLLTTEQRKEKLNATPDLNREKDPLFQDIYRNIILLIDVQVHLNLFQERLMHCKENPDHKNLVQQAMQDYETSIHNLFKQKANKDKDHTELTNFLLKDLYQTSAAKSGAASPGSHSSTSTTSDSSTTALTERLLHHVNSILQGSGTFARDTCQKKIRALLQDWHTNTLESPTLVQLGYMDGTSKETPPSAKKAIAEEDAMLRRFSFTGNNSNNINNDDDSDSNNIEWDPFNMPDPLFDSDLDESDPRIKKLPKFVPCPWPQDSEDDQHSSYQLTEDDKLLLQRRKKPKKPVNLVKLKPSNTLYSDTEEDPNNSSGTNNKKRDLTSFQPKGYTLPLPEVRKPKRKRVKTNNSKRNQKVPFSSNTQDLRLSPSEIKAIQEGVRKFGKGRWHIVQKQANGALDKLSPQTIKIAFQQLKRKGTIQDV